MQNYSFDLLGSNRGPSVNSISGFSLYLTPTFKCGVDLFLSFQKKWGNFANLGIIY